MDTLTQWIANNPVVTTWITLISLIGVLITAIALILQIKEKKRIAIFFTITSTILVDSELSQIDGVKILFNDNEVSTVVISKIKMWNGGNEILEESNFYSDHRLKIVVPQNEKILAAAVVEETDDTCKVKVIPQHYKENEMVVSFYCLEPQQGATINVYHTNTDEKETNLIGKIKAGKIINKSIDVGIEDGEMCISTSNHKIYIRNSILDAGTRTISLFPSILGISVVKKLKKRSRKTK